MVLIYRFHCIYRLIDFQVSNLEEKMKLATMTRVQQLTIPVILKGKDVLVKSQTGSGKTLAYAVPIVHSLASLPRRINRSQGPFALVIVPTREVDFLSILFPSLSLSLSPLSLSPSLLPLSFTHYLCTHCTFSR